MCGLEACCEEELSSFAPQPNSKHGKANICKSCKADYKRDWRQKRGKEYYRKQNRMWKQKIKITVMELYGNKCACCGEDGLPFLTMDHINNDGKKDREKYGRSYGMYIHMRNLFYKDKKVALSKYQILCWNCNMAKQHNGGVCPHKSMRKRDFSQTKG